MFVRSASTRLGAVTVAVALLLTGCAGAENTSSTTTSTPQSTSTAASEPAPTSATPEAVQNPAPVLTGEDLQGSIRAVGTLFWGCGGNDDIPSAFDTETGKVVSFPAPSTPAGVQLRARTCTLAGGPGNLRVVYLSRYRTPASGLTPESFTTIASTAAPGEKAVSQDVDVTGILPGVPDDIYPSAGGPVLSYCDSCVNGDHTYAIDPNTLTVKWSDSRVPNTVDDRSVLFDDIWENRVTIRDVASGQDVVLENMSPASWNFTDYHFDSGYLIEQHGLGDNVYGYYSTVANRFFPELIHDRLTNIMSVADGRLLAKTHDGFTLINITTGAVEFELDNQEVDVLDSYQYTHYGKYLYVSNNIDSPVFDITNKQMVSSGWKVRPDERIGQDWMVIDHRNTWSQHCYEGFDLYGCEDSEDVVLERVPGGAYPGPWF